MIEQYASSRDAYIAGNVAIGRAKANGDIRPSYVRAAAGPPSPDAQRGTLARLAAAAPGSIVRRDDS